MVRLAGHGVSLLLCIFATLKEHVDLESEERL